MTQRLGSEGKDGSTMGVRSNFLKWLHGTEVKWDEENLKQLNRKQKQQLERVLKKKQRTLKFLVHLKGRKKVQEQKEEEEKNQKREKHDMISDIKEKFVSRLVEI
mmetsp:Transcript_31755/g.48702  ORF Transcript_31755/g.48702 Transcript_31755/m.48702 type:complete len:105 (+) Transcript_31755:4381-4695(+)